MERLSYYGITKSGKVTTPEAQSPAEKSPSGYVDTDRAAAAVHSPARFDRLNSPT